MSEMLYTIKIDQPTALAWGLNCPQAMVFAVVHQLPTWADSVQIDGNTWYHLSKGKLASELPLLTSEANTAGKYLRQLVKAGVIETTTFRNQTHVRVTEKGKEWNRTKHPEVIEGGKNIPPKEKTPTQGNKSEGAKNNPPTENNPDRVGNISQPGSEKYPTDEYYNNPSYKDPEYCADLADARPSPEMDSEQPGASSPDPTQALNGELVDDDIEIVPGWTFARLIDPPEQDPDAGTYIALPLRSDQNPPVHFVTDRDVLNLQQTYRGIDVADEFRLMLGWTIANPAKRKTTSGIRKSIANWLGRAKERGGSPFGPNAKHLVAYEKTGHDLKAKRENVRQALRDIHNTDW